MSNIVSSKMTLTIDDQKWIKKLFDRQDEVNETLLAETFNVRDALLAKALAEIIQEQNKCLLQALEDQNKLITEIKLDITSIMTRLDAIEANLDGKEIRLLMLEKYASLPNSIARSFIRIIIGIGLGWILHSLIS